MKRLLAIVLVVTACFVVSARAEGATDPEAPVPTLSTPDSADPVPAGNPQNTTPNSSGTQTSTRHKSVAATVLLSLLIPGGGNFYTGSVGKGLLFLGTGIGGAALMASSVNECIGRFCSIDDVSSGKLYGGLGIVGAAHVLDLITALHRANDINSGKISRLDGLRLSVNPVGKNIGVKVAYNLKF